MKAPGPTNQTTMKNETTQAVILGVAITNLKDSSKYAKANRVTIKVCECCDAFTLRKEWGIFIELWEPNGTVISRNWLREYKCPKSWFQTKAQAVQALPLIESSLRDYLTTRGWLKQD